MLCIPPTNGGKVEKRKESGESEEEEKRFYSVLMVEHAQLSKSQEKRTDQID